MEKKPANHEFQYDTHARTCAIDDFQRQVCRTVNGKPIPDDQLQLIEQAILNGLQLEQADIVLDLACGNGALSQFMFELCKGYRGIDISDFLISVANTYFARTNYEFVCKDALNYVLEEPLPQTYTKALCYAGFQYFTDDAAVFLLQCLHQKYSHLQRIFIGNQPDRDKAKQFYQSNMPSVEELLSHTTAIGKWRTQADFFALASQTGWRATIQMMPDTFYSAHYRFDVILDR